MKKLSVMLLAFVLLLGTGISTAAVAAEKVNDEPSITQEIASLLQNLDIELKEDLLSNVTFTVNSENEIVVLTVETENEIVEAYIKSRLNYHKLENSLAVNKDYKVPVRIKV